MPATDGPPPDADVLRETTLGPFRLRETRYPGDAFVPAHEHESFNLCVTLSGRCVERRNGTSRGYVGPALTLNLPSSGHELRIRAEGVRCFSLSGPSSWLRDFTRAAENDVVPVVNSSDPRALGRALLLCEELRAPDAASVAAVEELLVEVLAETGDLEPPEAGGEPPAWLRRARAILRDESPGGPSLSALADRVGVHRVHLARCFRRHYGTSVGAYARGLRLRKAEREIAGGDRELGQIALRAGFYDQSHFNRHFRRATGMTPSRFRRLARGG